MRIPRISRFGDKETDTANITLILEGNAILEGSENKDTIFFPCKFLSALSSIHRLFEDPNVRSPAFDSKIPFKSSNIL